jgi:hypothetical protein
MTDTQVLALSVGWLMVWVPLGMVLAWWLQRRSERLYRRDMARLAAEEPFADPYFDAVDRMILERDLAEWKK